MSHNELNVRWPCILPIKQFDDQIGLTERFIACLNDPRDPDLTRHHVDEMVRQRIFGILAGYEDGHDHDTPRGDPIFKMVSGRTPNDDDLASQPTLSRFENAVDIPSLWRLHDFFLDDFIGSFDTPPAESPSNSTPRTIRVTANRNEYCFTASPSRTRTSR